MLYSDFHTDLKSSIGFIINIYYNICLYIINVLALNLRLAYKVTSSYTIKVPVITICRNFA